MSRNPTCFARLVEWSPEKGYGFLEYEGKRLTLHAHDFTGVNRRVQVGDEILFTVGTDNDGRRCAKNARHAGNGFRLINLLILTALLVVPVQAIQRLGQAHDYRIIWGSVAFVFILTLVIYWEDKRRARAGGWRVPENTMHLLELIGGWPAAYLAQGLFRHKRGKFSYQLTFWLIVGLYQFVAIDYLRGWPLITVARQGVAQVMKGK
jgi:uncharacterized membrane protein YsdA (DUF1294 family)